MNQIKHVDEWKEHIFPALISKKDELVLMGYSEVKIEEIWNCLKHHVWKNNEKKKLYEVVQDVLHLPSHTYMNYLTLNVLQSDDELANTVASLTDLLPNEKVQKD